MTIYHYCCKRDARRIEKSGITLGKISIWDDKHKRWKFRAGFQWLTLSEDPDAQSWDTHYLLRYSRTEVRITIDIPEAYMDHVYDMENMCQVVEGVDPYLYKDWTGSENWRVYRGNIPKQWIKAIETV